MLARSAETGPGAWVSAYLGLLEDSAEAVEELEGRDNAALDEGAGKESGGSPPARAHGHLPEPLLERQAGAIHCFHLGCLCGCLVRLVRLHHEYSRLLTPVPLSTRLLGGLGKGMSSLVAWCRCRCRVTAQTELRVENGWLGPDEVAKWRDIGQVTIWS